MNQDTKTHTSQNANRLREYLTTPSAATSILAVLVWIVLVLNINLWSGVSERLDILSFSGGGYVLALSSLMITVFAIPLLLLAHGWLLKPLLCILLVLSSIFAYFTSEFGVVYDVDMIRNVLETISDRNTQEGLELISWPMISSMLITALPALAWLVFSNVKTHSFSAELFKRAISIIALLAITATLILLNFKSISYFSRENKDLEIYVNPHFALYSVVKLIKRTHAANNVTFTELGTDATIVNKKQRPTIGVMVVGETARADHFSLNGYVRETNPLLAQRPLVNFSNTTACGTSTAYSVPCMFSFLTADQYSPEAAHSQSNVLDVLSSAGVQVTWLDNNSSCKGVCDRVKSINFMRLMDTRSVHYVDGSYHDEFLLSKLQQQLENVQEDTLIVIHTLGSHGPAYFRRVPGSFAKFTPYCQDKAPQNCSLDEIVNAYDNTILYTDYILSLVIARLETLDADTFMFYASDHGESLGENGVFLHGLPKMIAPKAQLHVPMMTWFSPSFPMRDQQHSKTELLQHDFASTHDNISATLLGLYDVSSDLYRKDLDLFSAPN